MKAAQQATLVAIITVSLGGILSACSGCETDNQGGGGFGQGGAGADGGNGSGNGGTLFDGGQQECANDDDCNGGVCHNGKCCPSSDLICGDGCCTSSEICLFNACVTPGDDCVSAADCPEDHYCEPALGDGGAGGGMGGNCTQPLEYGKCLPLPPICGEGGGGAGGMDCVEPCEYHPGEGQLNAGIKWQWGYDPPPTEYVNKADVWSTPTVARIYDANCDGKVDLGDPPNVVFVSGNSLGTYCSAAAANGACRKGALRMLDGKSGEEIWSLNTPEQGSQGFAGLSVAVGDVDQDQQLDIVALSGEGKVVVVDGTGVVKHISTQLVEGHTSSGFGWGGGVALGDMDFDGWPEIAYGNTVFTMDGGTLSFLFQGTAGGGGNVNRRVTHFVDLDGDGDLELLAGNTAYHHDGSILWTSSAADGFTATGDFDGDLAPEVVVVSGGQVWVLEGLTGAIELGPAAITGTGNGGPPTVADFDGDQAPEIGVAMQNYYSMMKPNYGTSTIDAVWWTMNHDNSSSVTGSSVFDFEGDGKAEVIYNDECFLWVYDGQDGDILFTANTQSFTATEASIVADVDGDGHAEIVMISNGADPNQWTCAEHTGNDSYPAWSTPPGASAHKGITVWADVANSWVGTRTLWNQHAYSVSNICDPRDSACDDGSYYGQIPANQKKNWQISWLNNFRQNVQDTGLYNAPDPTVLLSAECVEPVPMEVQVRNIGLSGLPANVQVDIYRLSNPDVLLGTVYTTKPLLAGQTEVIPFVAPDGQASTTDTFQARIVIDPNNLTFNECKDDNNESDPVSPECVQ